MNNVKNAIEIIQDSLQITLKKQPKLTFKTFQYDGFILTQTNNQNLIQTVFVRKKLTSNTTTKIKEEIQDEISNGTLSKILNISEIPQIKKLIDEEFKKISKLKSLPKQLTITETEYKYEKIKIWIINATIQIRIQKHPQPTT